MLNKAKKKQYEIIGYCSLYNSGEQKYKFGYSTLSHEDNEYRVFADDLNCWVDRECIFRVKHNKHVTTNDNVSVYLTKDQLKKYRDGKLDWRDIKRKQDKVLNELEHDESLIDLLKKENNDNLLLFLLRDHSYKTWHKSEVENRELKEQLNQFRDSINGKLDFVIDEDTFYRVVNRVIGYSILKICSDDYFRCESYLSQIKCI